MHNMPTDLLAAFVGVIAGLQALSIIITGLETAAKRIEGRSTWVAKDGRVFEEFEVTELERSQVMQQEFKDLRAESLLAGSLKLQTNG